jgi:hypothetical protein
VALARPLVLLLLVAALAGCGSDSATPEDVAQDANTELTRLLETVPASERSHWKDGICTGIQVGYSQGDWETSLDDPELRPAVIEIQETLAETEGATTAFVEQHCS